MVENGIQMKLNKINEDINTIEFWDTFYKGCDSNKVWMAVEFDKERCDEIIDCFPKQDGLNVLEIGCGRGHFIRYAKTKFPFKTNYFGVDISQEAINKCIESDKESKYWASDWINLYGGTHYDIVVCSEVMEHVNNIETLISNIKAMTNIKAIFTTPQENQVDAPSHIWSFKADDIISLFGEWHRTKIWLIKTTNPYKQNYHFMIEAIK